VVSPEDHSLRVQSFLDALGIPREAIARRSLALQPQAQELELVESGQDGEEHYLVPSAAQAWREMQSAASADAVTIRIVSAFRGMDRQAEIISRKLAAGLSLEVIFAASAPPGYSEHHTGRAVDITTPGAIPLEPEFRRNRGIPRAHRSRRVVRVHAFVSSRQSPRLHL
jgi:D-alanyl-D-alanine carboxypeptidase